MRQLSQPTIIDFLGNPSVKRAEKHLVKAPDGIEKYVLAGWAPASPFITKGDRVTTFGSCFGHVIREFLQHPNFGYRVTPLNTEENTIPMAENGFRFVSTALIYQQFVWAWERGPMIWDRWMNQYSQGIDEDLLRQRTKAIFDDTRIFIITLGLSEIWRDKTTHTVRFGPLHKDLLGEDNTEFYILSCAETKSYIQGVIDIIHKYNAGAQVVFAVSPIPLQTTFRDVSSITANCVSKSIIRAALDEVLRENKDDDKVWYWPSYEIIQEMPVEDKWEPDGWHPLRCHSDEIVRLFRKYYFCE